MLSRGICRYRPFIAAIVAVLALSACGSSGDSGRANALLRQTFSSGHSVKSGVIAFNMGITPTGSSTFSTPIQFGVDGPFQSRGGGKLPQSDLTISIAGLGRHGALTVISTGTAGYVTVDGTSYQLPAADFAKLQSSFSSTSGGSGDAGLAQLGINPLHWLTSPSIVGTETVGGVSTTHIRADVNVKALISDLNTFLSKRAATTSAANLPTQIPPATAQKIASAVKHATVNIWTGKSDTTLRRLTLDLSVPITGRISTELGGMSSAAVTLTLQYGDLNQPQSVAAPANPQPYTQFEAKLQTIGQGLSGVLGSAAGATGSLGSGSSASSSSGSATTGSSGSAGSGAGSSSATGKYTACIEKANGDVTKMQKCASLLNGGS